MEISKKQYWTLTTVFNKLLENVSFDFRFKKISTSGQTFKPITSGEFEIGQRFFDILLVLTSASCMQKISNLKPRGKILEKSAQF